VEMACGAVRYSDLDMKADAPGKDRFVPAE
jgi:hypothetical protein